MLLSTSLYILEIATTRRTSRTRIGSAHNAGGMGADSRVLSGTRGFGCDHQEVILTVLVILWPFELDRLTTSDLEFMLRE